MPFVVPSLSVDMLYVTEQGGVSPSQFLHSASVFMTAWDVFGGLAKTVVFGLIVAMVSCRQGLATQGGAVGVGRATTNAVVYSMVLIYVSNYFLAAVLFTGNH